MASSPGGVCTSVDTRAHGRPPYWIAGATVQRQQLVLHLSSDISRDTVSMFVLLLYYINLSLYRMIDQSDLLNKEIVDQISKNRYIMAGNTNLQ